MRPARYLAGAVPHREPAALPRARRARRRARCSSSRCRPICCWRHRARADGLRRGPSRRSRRADSCVVGDHRICRRGCGAVAHVVLPIGTFAETSGTYVNLEGRWQSWAGAAKPLGREPPGLEGAARARQSARSARLRLPVSEQVRDAFEGAVRRARAAPTAPRASRSRRRRRRRPGRVPTERGSMFRRIQCDVLVRGSEALAKTQGRAHGPRRALTMWQWSPIRDWLSGRSRRTGPCRCSRPCRSLMRHDRA